MYFWAHNLLCILHALAFTFLCSVLLLAAIATYRLVLHPLSQVPGPRLAAVSNVWYAYHVRNGSAFRLAKVLHKQYGPVVRVGPNEVWVNSADGFRSIYGAGSGYDKSDFYLATALHQPKVDWLFRLHFPDSLDFLSEANMVRYRLQRRLIGTTYQTPNLKKFEGAIDDVIAKAIAQIKLMQGQEVDLKEWMHIIAVECLGATILSWSPGYIRDKSDGGTSTQGYLGWRRKSVLGLFPFAVVASLLSSDFNRAFSNLWGVTYPTPPKFKPFFTAIQQKTSRRIKTALKPKPPRQYPNDLLADLIQLHKDKPAFSETYLRRLAITNFGAGHETMCSALTAAVAMIGSHDTTRERVTREVRTATDHGPMSYDNAIRLRVTQASIREAQRLYPVIGMSLPRRVPAGGMRAHSHYFPPGTTVGCNPASLHRNPDIFGTDAEEFNLDRWLRDGDGNDDAVRTMERYNLTWGGGARRCPGRHLAELIVYKVIPALVKEFDIEVTMPPEEEIRFYFMAMLTGVKARFLPRKNESRRGPKNHSQFRELQKE